MLLLLMTTLRNNIAIAPNTANLFVIYCTMTTSTKTTSTEPDNITMPSCELTIVMPCLNEEETLAICIDKAHTFIADNNISGEVLIADNGSTDRSRDIASEHGARITSITEKGYGAALMGGISAAKGKYIIMGDADDSYDFSSLDLYVEKLREGYDLVMGNRFKGGIAKGAMPPLHRYLGNPILTGIGRLFFKSPLSDFHCGLRGFKKEAIERLDLQTTGMEFASEMIVKATLSKLRITEIPTTLAVDGRSCPPHLRSWRDGWRHLQFLLIYSPRWLFLYPGIILITLGLALMMWLLPGQRTVFGIGFDIHTMLYAAISIILGFQAVSFAIFSKVYAINTHLLPVDHRTTTLLKIFTLDRGLIVSGIFFTIGIIGSLYAFIDWGLESFGPLVPSSTMRITIPSLTALTVGIQVGFSSFFLGVLGLSRKQPPPTANN